MKLREIYSTAASNNGRWKDLNRFEIHFDAHFDCVQRPRVFYSLPHENNIMSQPNSVATKSASC